MQESMEWDKRAARRREPEDLENCRSEQPEPEQHAAAEINTTAATAQPQCAATQSQQHLQVHGGDPCRPSDSYSIPPAEWRKSRAGDPELLCTHAGTGSGPAAADATTYTATTATGHGPGESTWFRTTARQLQPGYHKG